MARPKKEKQDEKNNRFTVRFTDAEAERILHDAKLSGLSVSEYIREQVNKGKVVARYEIVTETDVRAKLAEEYHKIGVNLNQIAHHLNAEGSVTNDLLLSIEDCVSALADLRRNLR